MDFLFESQDQHDEVHVLIQLAIKYCTNLEEIRAYANDVRKIELIVKMKQLKSLYFEYCYCREEQICPDHAVNSFVKPLSQLPNLKRLTLYGFPSSNTELNCIQNLIQLEDLRLRGICRDSDNYVNINEICSPLKNLRVLFLRYLGCINFNQLELNNLEFLEIINVVLANSLPYFPNLKSLTLFPRFKLQLCNVMSKNILSQYANQLEKFHFFNHINLEDAHLISKLISLKDLRFTSMDETAYQYVGHLKQLERLTFYDSRKLSIRTLLSILRECKHLRYLSVQNVHHLTHDFIYNALDICHSNGIHSNNPLKLFLHGSSIDTEIVKKLSTHSNGNLLAISFKYIDAYDEIMMRI
ncbi:uncharacterized protein LOC124460730 [Drosophila willistoni]|uniref:uncharacterized protein LOC124460730 n=1 Tax=Drosophila willistoni TaxID=7260 RepID=UPI001F07FF5E|nr:uncharacterized protein LOC124460730 [Drosophila willistoni]